MKLVNGGITINVSSLDAQQYLRAGFVEVKEEPVSEPAQPQPKAKQPEAEEPEAQKSAKKGVANGRD